MKLMIVRILFTLIGALIAASSFAKAPICEKGLSDADLNSLSKKEHLSAYCFVLIASQIVHQDLQNSQSQTEQLMKSPAFGVTESSKNEWAKLMSKNITLLTERNQCIERANHYYQSFQAKFGHIPNCNGK